MDDALEQEVRGMMTAGHDPRAEEWNSPEPSGEDQPTVDLSADGSLHGGVPDGMTEDDVTQRSALAQYLGKEVWPATGAQLLAVAQGRNAPDAVVALLRQAHADVSYLNLQEVWSAISGGHVEQHRF